MRSPLHTLVLAAMIVSLLPSTAAAVAGFGDVDDGRFYSEPVAWMVAEGITTGTAPGCFTLAMRRLELRLPRSFIA